MIRRLILMLLFTGMLVWLPVLSVAQEDVPADPNVTIHVVQRGENLFRIALNYGLTTDVVAEANGINNVNNIAVGQRLVIPIPANPAPEPLNHIVQAGETLRSIADLYGQTVEDLAELNEIENVNQLYVGQELVIVPDSNALTIAPTPTPIPDSDLPTDGEVIASTVPFVHTVQSGDTLFRIALQYNVELSEIATANDILDPTRIDVGQQLIIPGVELPELALDLPPIITGLDVKPLIFVEGQTGRLAISTQASVTITGQFLERDLSIIPLLDGTQHIILIGIPIFTEAGIYELTLTLTESNGTVSVVPLNILIASGGYGRQTIEIIDELAELLAPAVEDNEITLITNLTSNVTPDRYFEGSLGLPAAATMNGPFGTIRSYNGGPFDNYHRGADFAGVPGTSVLAAASGQVVLADTLQIRGNTVIIDHGWGVYTLYAHQQALNVVVGDFVQTGQILGTIGSTGRVTGAHLHWEVWVNGVTVDPLQWVSESFP